jgi:nucleoid-associated protein YgaU/DNA-binding SARP family transcriptional activator
MTNARHRRVLTDRPASRRATVRDVVRGVTAFLLLTALVLGMPAALWALSASLQPFEDLGPSNLISALTRPDDGSLFLAALMVVAWTGWLVFAASIALEVVAFVRGVPTPRLPLLRLPQQGAAALVATAALLVTSGTTFTSAPLARPVAAAVLDLRTTPVGHAPVALGPAAVQATWGSEASRNHPTVTVRRHDTLWSLAETHLGSGERFREIVALNVGRPQSDGRELTDSHWVYPGWVLRLPSDAKQAEPRKARLAGAGDVAEVVTVEPGDSLWGIAEGELGDGLRYGEVYELNEGRLQPDGRTLSDPDEIRPGWRLALPITPGLVDGAHESLTPPTATSAPTPPPTLPVAGPVVSTTVPTTTPTAPNRVVRAPVADSTQDEDSAALALALGLGTVTAAGLMWELRRRRRLQQRHRRVGDRISMPEPELAAVEARVTSAASPVTVETVRDALRALMASCVVAKRLLPDVVLVRVSSSTILLELQDDDPDAVPPFAAVNARTWQLDGPTQVGPDDPDPYPALVTLGVDFDDLLLLNLESVGTLHVIGPTDRVAEVVRAFAVDLAVGPLSGAATLTFAACFPELAQSLDPGKARHLHSSQQAEREIDVRTESTHELLAASGSQDVRGARSHDVGTDVTMPEVVVGEQSAAGWAVVLGSDAGATLQPLDLPFSPQALSQGDFDGVVSLLTTAQVEPRCATAAGDDIGEREVVSSALPDVPELVLDLRDLIAAPPRVLVLGNVQVERADDEAAPNRRRRATELVAYLALHPGATSHQIDEAMWPGKRIEKTTRSPFVSRARQWLGRTPDGEPYLPQAADGGTYRLRPDVSCDWHDFVRFSQLGLASGPDAAGALTAALALVRGRPFLGVDPATYTWAEADIQEMISAVVDVAHVLSVARFDAGDYRGAQEAAAKGLLAEPCSELLYRDAIRAAAAAGDRDEVERLAARLRHEIELVDPEETLDEETANLIVSV